MYMVLSLPVLQMDILPSNDQVYQSYPCLSLRRSPRMRAANMEQRQVTRGFSCRRFFPVNMRLWLRNHGHIAGRHAFAIWLVPWGIRMQMPPPAYHVFAIDIDLGLKPELRQPLKIEPI